VCLADGARSNWTYFEAHPRLKNGVHINDFWHGAEKLSKISDWRRKIEAEDRAGLEGLLSYMERPVVSLRRLQYGQDGLVHYQGTKLHPPWPFSFRTCF
jgi:hypothetical protein